jgi:hypothetical protein
VVLVFYYYIVRCAGLVAGAEGAGLAATGVCVLCAGLVAGAEGSFGLAVHSDGLLLLRGKVRDWMCTCQR